MAGKMTGYHKMPNGKMMKDSAMTKRMAGGQKKAGTGKAQKAAYGKGWPK